MDPPRAVVVTYHSISAGPPPLAVWPRQFEAHLDAFEAAGYEAVSLNGLVEAFKGDGRLPDRCFVLTFDDGYRDFVDAALPILERRGLEATLFVTAAADRSGLEGGAAGPLVAFEDLSELAGRGVEIGAHSVSHPDLTTLGDDELGHELRRSRDVLEHHTRRPVEHFAYPYGFYDARVREATGAVFRSAVTTRLVLAGPGADVLALPRLDAYYLGSPLLRRLLASGPLTAYLQLRRWLRLLRGTERFV